MQRIRTRPQLGHTIRQIRNRPRLRLLEGVLVGAAIGIGNALLWKLILGLPWWAVGLIAIPSALLLIGLAAGAQRGLADRRRPRRRAHVRPHPKTRRTAA